MFPSLRKENVLQQHVLQQNLIDSLNLNLINTNLILDRTKFYGEEKPSAVFSGESLIKLICLILYAAIWSLGENPAIWSLGEDPNIGSMCFFESALRLFTFKVQLNST